MLAIKYNVNQNLQHLPLGLADCTLANTCLNKKVHGITEAVSA
jgi:hypothetical protein